jgi:hypothetical protein
MAKIPKIRVNTPVPFPALVQGSGPVTVAKNKGIWSIGLSTAGIPQQTPPPGSLPTDLVLVWDSVAQQWITVPLSSLGGSGGGIADAPNDGVQYGRQSMGWTPITGGGSFNPASPPPIGNVAPNAGAFSSLSATGTTTLGQVTQLGIPNSAILRVGLQGRAGNSFIDFNSSGLPPDFDVRLISPTGAGTAADGSGTLQMQGTLNIKSVPATTNRPGHSTVGTGDRDKRCRF